MFEFTMELCLEQRSNIIIRAKLRTLLKIPMAFLQKQLMAKSPYFQVTHKLLVYKRVISEFALSINWSNGNFVATHNISSRF